jgi:hypothetical protein
MKNIEALTRVDVQMGTVDEDESACSKHQRKELGALVCILGRARKCGRGRNVSVPGLSTSAKVGELPLRNANARASSTKSEDGWPLQ